MSKKEIEVTEKDQDITIILEGVIEIENVVVTGIMGTRDKATFTGAVTSVRGDDLREIGTQSAIQALAVIDPSFVIQENILRGSDPNAMPEVEIRGRTGISVGAKRDELATDPNQPLFILDGFQITAERFNDLDINRIASITLLKDAGSTAIYGSKAANGVVVIETIRPQVGKIRVNYKGHFEVSAPDLSSYNLMNAREKLEFELKSGRFSLGNGPTDKSGNFKVNQYELEELYNKYLKQVESGVNTYWINEPVRTAFTNKHTIVASGGVEALTFDVTLSYGNRQGVMKGSFRKTYEGSVFLNYRKGNLNVSNRVIVNGYNSEESPYREFSKWTSANPYYKKRNEDGSVPKYLEQYNPKDDSAINKAVSYILHRNATSTGATYRNIINPLYDAQLGMLDEENNFEVTNQFNLRYDVSSDFKLEGNFNIKKGTTDRNLLKPYGLSDFQYETDENLKGSGYNRYSKVLNYDGRILGSYAKVIDGHSFFGQFLGMIRQSDSRSIRFDYTGFPEGVRVIPSLAFNYKKDSSPVTSHLPNRSVSSIFRFNYNYFQRYLFDATFNYEGANSFGSNNNFRPFWSLGTGWNIDREEFMEDVEWVSAMKLRINYGLVSNSGITGNTFTSMSISNNPGYFGAAYQIVEVGNENLKWPQTNQLSLGAEMGFLNNRITANFSYYDKLTDPMVASLTLAPSTGMTTYFINCGTLHTKGFEFVVSGKVINDLQNRIIWTVTATGASEKSVYGKFGRDLDAINEALRQELEEDSNLMRFMDGYSPTDMWTVRSLGIDPVTGREIFRTKTGETTFEYRKKDEVRIANEAPKLHGFFSTNVIYKNLSLTANFQYSVGGYQFNTAVYNKVENILWESLGKNLDRRALYERWQKPGDIAEFKSIESAKVTPISSRYIQKNNFVNFSYLNLSYNFSNLSWLKQYGIQGLRISAFTSNLFRISTIKTERGLDFPFARTYSLDVGISF